ncbi:DUF6976 family protein [Ideonella dechloratans]|uniref:DUF6976 family protein n=1 Tax=Ideonella dechloratans TaxID=36863 RepID=UPI0035B3B5CD
MNALTHRLVPLDEAARLIQARKPCCIAGDEALLRQLPRGDWIGGTIAYFMTDSGGTCSRQQVFVTELPAGPRPPGVRLYARSQLSRVCLDGPEHGFSVMVLPAFSEVHEAFAQEAPGYEDMYMKPLVGWVAGMHLDEPGTRPRVVDGQTGLLHDNAAVVIHLPLPETALVHVDILNLFAPGDGPVIEFARSGFTGGDCLIDGQPANLHDWWVRQGADPRWPLVADYHGALINVSIKALDAAHRRVEFYAPVFPGVGYRLARPLPDYSAAFARAAAGQTLASDPVFCCNCILNYLHGQLQGRRTGRFQGPMTFGEIGYQLLNQTLVHLSVEGL